jgi:hypothetical protein
MLAKKNFIRCFFFTIMNAEGSWRVKVVVVDCLNY